MVWHKELGSYLTKAALLLSVLAILSSCGRSGTSAPAPLEEEEELNPLSGNNGGANSIPPPPAVPTNPGTGNQSNPPTQNPTPFTCSIVLSGGTAVATQSPMTPSMVNYLLTVTPTMTSVPQPTITTDPTNKFAVQSMVPNGSKVTITGNFNTAGAIKVKAALNVSGQPVNCEVTTNVVQGSPPTAVVYRFDRANPPDIFYSTSQSGAPPGFEYKGAMFKVYTSPPSSAMCTPLPLVQCVTNSATKPTTFLAQYANCENYKYPFISQLGYTCGQQVTGVQGLMRLTNNIDYRYFETTSPDDRNRMQSQGWIYQGLIGYAPLQ